MGEGNDRNHPKPLPRGRQADGRAATPDEPVGDMRALGDKAEAPLSYGGDDAVVNIQLPQRVAETGKDEAESHQESGQRHQDARSKPVKGVSDRRRYQRINQRVQRDYSGADAVGPVKLFQQGNVEDAEGAEGPAHEHHVEEAEEEDDVTVVEARTHDRSSLCCSESQIADYRSQICHLRFEIPQSLLSIGDEPVQLFEKIPDRASMVEIRQRIQRRRVAVDNGQKSAALFGQDRKGGGRLDL